ncbi:MAG TPA: glycosyltransferase family 2 protein [Xanthobacteraceae bacterium]|nr:glycosyltransferase family 2 protein [Xanthobacteraceae bacterium]
MAEKRYSILVPTRERPDVLYFTIKTILKLTRPNYELIVMDNHGGPETEQVVKGFESPNIRYFRSPERLSMTDNWEHALEHATGDYITFLGDDDGIMPDAIEIAERFHRHWPDRILSWWPFVWMWPDSLVPGYPNFTRMHFGAHAARCSSRQFLKDLLAFKKHFLNLPTLYCSFVPRQMIEAVRLKHGRYFLASLPDVYSGIANLCSSDEFFYCYRPLTAWGISRHSTGASKWFGAGESGEQFDAENRQSPLEASHPRLSGAELIVEVQLANLYLQMKEKLFPHDDGLQLDIAGLLRHISTAGARRFHSRRDALEAAIKDMALKNGLDPAEFPVVLRGKPGGPGKFSYRMLPDENNVISFQHFTDPNSVRTIEDFVAFAHRMCLETNQIKIPRP